MTTTPSEVAQQHQVDDLPLWRDAGAYDVLREALSHHKVEEEVFARLLSAYRDHAHKQRPRGITADLDEIFQSISAEA